MLYLYMHLSDLAICAKVITVANTDWCMGISCEVTGLSWLFVSLLFIVIPISFFKFNSIFHIHLVCLLLTEL